MIRRRTTFPTFARALAACAALAGLATADLPVGRPAQQDGDGDPGRTVGRPPELDTSAFARDERSARAIERGLAWLAARQAEQRDGSLPRAGGERHVPVALAAFAAVAFMADGNTLARGPHAAELAAAVDYLLARADLNPASPARGYIASEGDDTSRMHGHGYATLALAQAYAISPRTQRGQRIAETLEAAARLIEASQGLEGGWFYLPQSGIEHENSVTVVMLQALRAARSVGVQVDAERIARAVEYIRRCQSENGRFRYKLDPASETSVALTAAGIMTLYSAGRFEGAEVERANAVLWQDLVARESSVRVRPSDFPHYERFYLALALWQNPDARLFERWAAPEREGLLATQRDDGSWHDEEFGACYATAMNCLFLALPQRLLPLFER